MRIASQYSSEQLLLAQPICALLLDIDGVMTDGSLLYADGGELLKRFHVLDGQGIMLLKQAGVSVFVVSGRDGTALRKRLGDLAIEHFALGVASKLEPAEQLLNALGLQWSQVAVVGDDWPDLPLIERAGFSAAPRNAHAEVSARVHYASAIRGGEGMVREICDLLLQAKGAYAGLLETYLKPR